MKELLLTSFVYLLLFCACSDEEAGQSKDATLKIATEMVDFKQTADKKEVQVTCNGDWAAKVASDGTWCTLTRNGNGLSIAVTESDQQKVRETVVTVTSGSENKTIKVRQLGHEAAILVSRDIFSVAASGEEIKLDITTNIDKLDITSSEWIQEKKSLTRAFEMVTTTHTFVVRPQTADAERIGDILIKAADLDKKVTIAINQKGLGDYESTGIENIKDDIKVKITGGEASSLQPGSGLEKSFDGDMTTIYHSKWDNSAADYFPITLTYRFAAGSDMDYFVYYPRADGQNGLFKEVEIRVKSNANARGADEWTTVVNKNFGGRNSAVRVDFPHSQIGVSEVQFIVKSGSGDRQGFATCAEMEFYKKNPDAFDPSTLFTDETCSELKPGVTDQEIENCSYSFFKNIAFYMKQGKYAQEFRIATFDAYPDPNIQSASHKVNQYSQLDNPTGISVKKSEQLVLFVGDTGGRDISLRVQNLDVPGGDGFGGDYYPLTRGINKLTMRNKGLAYVMYHTSTLEEAATAVPIKMHFASGAVNGYYDVTKHEGSRFKELLNKAIDPYFDVVGKYAHLTFPTIRFKNHTGNGKLLIDTYDNLVQHQMELLGLFKYNCTFRNRMYFNVIYKSYMYATAYHTGYNDTTLGELCDESKLSTSACWGPAHEVGHCNQTRPGLKWLGTTEVTNNIMSEYIQTTIFKQDSRIQAEDMGVYYRNRYSKAWSSIIAEEAPHGLFTSYDDEKGSDVFCKLVPFWQLELYFGRVLGKTPLQQADKGGLYPDIYEYIRNHPDQPSAGTQQTEFVYICSKLSGYNLLDFFTKWGFLTPIDVIIEDYATGPLLVTQARIDEIKQRVNALGLPKPTVALEYISDNTWELYRKKPAVVKGTATRSGNLLTMNNWQNVVVYEVTDGSTGQLKFVCSGETTPSSSDFFTLPFNWKETFKVHAVDASGARTEVTF